MPEVTVLLVNGKPVKRFVAYFYSNGMSLQLGFHFSLAAKNIEIHVPFGFFRIGYSEVLNYNVHRKGWMFRTLGWNGERWVF